MRSRLTLNDDLTLALPGVAITLSPAEGLQLAEDLARKSFRRVFTDEAARHPQPTAKSKRRDAR